MIDDNLIEFCKYCGCEDFEEKAIAYEANCVSEREYICKKCGSLINYWSYGFYENDIDDDYKRMLLNKKIKRIRK